MLECILRKIVVFSSNQGKTQVLRINGYHGTLSIRASNTPVQMVKQFHPLTGILVKNDQGKNVIKTVCKKEFYVYFLILAFQYFKLHTYEAVHKGYPTFQLVSRFAKMGYEDI